MQPFPDSQPTKRLVLDFWKMCHQFFWRDFFKAANATLVQYENGLDLQYKVSLNRFGIKFDLRYWKSTLGPCYSPVTVTFTVTVSFMWCFHSESFNCAHWSFRHHFLSIIMDWCGKRLFTTDCGPCKLKGLCEETDLAYFIACRSITWC